MLTVPSNYRRAILLVLALAITIFVFYTPSGPALDLDPSSFIAQGEAKDSPRLIFNGLVSDDGVIMEDAVQEMNQLEKERKIQGKDMEHKLRVMKEKLKGKPKAQRQRKN